MKTMRGLNFPEYINYYIHKLNMSIPKLPEIQETDESQVVENDFQRAVMEIAIGEPESDDELAERAADFSFLMEVQPIVPEEELEFGSTSEALRAISSLEKQVESQMDPFQNQILRFKLLHAKCTVKREEYKSER